MTRGGTTLNSSGAARAFIPPLRRGQASPFRLKTIVDPAVLRAARKITGGDRLIPQFRSSLIASQRRGFEYRVSRTSAIHPPPRERGYNVLTRSTPRTDPSLFRAAHHHGPRPTLPGPTCLGFGADPDVVCGFGIKLGRNQLVSLLKLKLCSARGSEGSDIRRRTSQGQDGTSPRTLHRWIQSHGGRVDGGIKPVIDSPPSSSRRNAMLAELSTPAPS